MKNEESAKPENKLYKLWQIEKHFPGGVVFAFVAGLHKGVTLLQFMLLSLVCGGVVWLASNVATEMLRNKNTTAGTIEAAVVEILVVWAFFSYLGGGV